MGDREWNPAGFEYDEEIDGGKKASSITLSGRNEATAPVIDLDIANQLRPYLPPLHRLPTQWSLLYSMDQHGISLGTFYRRCEALSAGGGTLIAVRDTEDGVFGVWIGEAVRCAKGGYYGSGESFLWKITTGASDPPSSPTSETIPEEEAVTAVAAHPTYGVQIFRWTGANDYVALCEPDFISFGGGDGRYGLYIDSSLIDGSSAHCPTFANDTLCGAPGPPPPPPPSSLTSSIVLEHPRARSDSPDDQELQPTANQKHQLRDALASYSSQGSTSATKTVRFECVGLEAWGVGGV